jgi:hypothetical protein
MAKLKGKAKAAFLRRMARGRNKRNRNNRPARKSRKHRKDGGNVKRKRRSQFGRKVRRHARRAHGAINKYIPKTDTLVSLATSYAYGKVEGEADKDAKHFLNSVPALVPQIGRAGNAGAVAWLIGVVTRQPTLKAVAAGVLHVAAYQNARGATFTKEKQSFTMGARGGSRRDEALVENYLRGQRE